MKSFSENEVKKCEQILAELTMPHGFVIEAERGDDTTHFYLYHKDYGVKTHIFWCQNESMDKARQEKLLTAYFTMFMENFAEKYLAKCTQEKQD